jgi:hypothetical protein
MSEHKVKIEREVATALWKPAGSLLEGIHARPAYANSFLPLDVKVPLDAFQDGAGRNLCEFFGLHLVQASAIGPTFGDELARE